MSTPRTIGRASPLRLAPPLVLASLVLIGFGRLVAGPGALIVDGDRPSLDRASRSGSRTVGNDLTRLFLPHHLRISEVVARTGRIPGWDPAGFGGRPLVGNPQAGVWYPPTWLAWRSGSPAALGWLTVGHLVLGGLGAYALARTIGIGTGGALVAGGCFELSPYLLAQTFEGHYPHVWAVCWYPWAFLGALALRRGDARGGLALPVILASAFLTGHPQEAYYLALALGAWAAWEGLARWRRGGWRGLVGVAASVSGIGALAVGLLAIEWLPASKAQAWGLKTARLSSRMASRYCVGPLNVAQLLSPNALGGPSDYLGEVNYWESVAAPGGMTLVLAFVGLARSQRRLAALGWGVLVGLSVAFSMGRWAGLYPVLYDLVPGMDRFRTPGRAVFLAALGSAMLAGLGAEAIARGRGCWAAWARAWAAGGALLAVTLIGAWYASPSGVSPDRAGRPSNEAMLWLRVGANLASEPFVWITLGSSAAAFIWLSRIAVRRTSGEGVGSPRPHGFGTRGEAPGMTARTWARPRTRVACVLATLALAELTVHAFDLIRIAHPGRFLTRDSLGETIARVRPEGAFRVRARDALLDDLRAVDWGLEKTNLGDAFQLQHAADLYEWVYPVFDPPRPDELMDPLAAWERRRRSRAVLDRMNVALLVTDRPDADGSWPVVAEGTVGGRRFEVLCNPTALPRAYVVPRAWPCADGAEAAALLPWVDPREAVMLTEDPLGDAAERQPFTPAEYRAAGPDRVEVVVDTEAAGLLVVADTWMPGWSATLDGRPAEILRGDRSQRVVALPSAGRHRVVMTYEPPGLREGRALALGSALVWALSALACRRRIPSSTARGPRIDRPGSSVVPASRDRPGMAGR